MPRISVIVPVYNGEKYLKPCIDSVLAQTFTDFELLAVNDGSKDGSPAILEEYARKDARVRVISQENAGVSAARNHALEEASGEYLAFIDADDWLEPDALAAAQAILEKERPDVWLWNSVLEYPDHQQRLAYENTDRLIGEAQELLDMRWCMFTEFDKNGKRFFGSRNVWAKFIRRELVEKGRIRFDEQLRLHEDTLFMLEVYEKARSLYITNDYWYHHRLEAGSVTSRYAPYAVRNNAEAALRMAEFLRENRKGADYEDFFKGILVFWLLQDFDLYVFHQQNPMSSGEKYRLAREILDSEPFASAFRESPRGALVIRSKRIYIWLARHRLVHLLAAYNRLFKWARTMRTKFLVRR